MLVACKSLRLFTRTLNPDAHAPVAALQSRFQRLDRAASFNGGRPETIGRNDDERSVSPRLPGENPREALSRKPRFRRFKRKRLRHEALKGNGRARVGHSARREPRENVLPHGVRREVEDRRAVMRTEGPRLSRKEKLQAVIHFGHRAYGRARGADDGVLINGNRRGHAFDRRHLRAVHAVEELARVGAEGLHVPALALRIKRIEDERAFPGPGKARDDGEAPDRNVEVKVLEIILLGAADADRRRRFIPGVAGSILLGHLRENSVAAFHFETLNLAHGAASGAGIPASFPASSRKHGCNKL